MQKKTALLTEGNKMEKDQSYLQVHYNLLIKLYID